MTKAHDPITPGEILRTEFLEPLEISQYRLAQATGLSQTRIGEIVRGRRRITTETGLRLSRALGTSERFWINIQADYDSEIPSSIIGRIVMQHLANLDQVAYVRFASVYRSFEDIDEFKTLVDEVRR